MVEMVDDGLTNDNISKKIFYHEKIFFFALARDGMQPNNKHKILIFRYTLGIPNNQKSSVRWYYTSLSSCQLLTMANQSNNKKKYLLWNRHIFHPISPDNISGKFCGIILGFVP